MASIMANIPTTVETFLFILYRLRLRSTSPDILAPPIPIGSCAKARRFYISLLQFFTSLFGRIFVDRLPHHVIQFFRNVGGIALLLRRNAAPDQRMRDAVPQIN